MNVLYKEFMHYTVPLVNPATGDEFPVEVDADNPTHAIRLAIAQTGPHVVEPDVADSFIDEYFESFGGSP